MTSSPDLAARLQTALGEAYRLERELGGGGMSRVFVATEVKLGRQVVIKVLPPEMSAAVQAERFQREVQVAASLQHPHVVPLLAAGAAGELHYYVMPFIEGESLADRLAREGALPVPDAARILRDVVDALAHAHARGVVHRDMKPGNVMLSGRHAMVTDFGVAKAVSASRAGGSSLTSLGVALGTPAYMAPEQAAADPGVDHRADLYAVGAVAYEMLAGRKPFEAPTPQAMLAAHLTGSPEPVGRYRASIPPALAAAVMRCLEKHPADRWQSATELGQALEEAMTPSGGTTPVSTAPYPSAAGSRPGHPGRVAALFTGAAAGVTLLAFAVTRLAGLPDWVWIGAAVLMAVGFPIMMYTSRLERRRAEARTRGTLRFGPESAHHGWFTWRRALLGGALALGGLTVVAAGYAGARALGIGPGRTLVSSGILGETDRLILADFTNRTPDSTLGPSLTEALRVDLGQSKVVRLMGTREIAAARTRMQLPAEAPVDEAVALEIAKREGAKAVISGEIASLGAGYVLTARVIETTTGEERVAVRETAADPEHLVAALDELSATLRERVGESLKSIRASEPLERVATPSLEALRVYSAGVHTFDEGDYEDAVPLFEKAIRADSGFGMAWRKLAVTLGNLGTRRTEARAAALRSYELRDRLPPVERYLAEALYFSNVEPDNDRAIAAYRAVLDFDPDETAALNNLGLMLNREERFAEAEVVLRQGLERTGRRTFYDNLFESQTAQGKWAAAESTLALAETRLPSAGAFAGIRRVAAAVMARDYARAESLYAVVPESLVSQADHRSWLFGKVDINQATGRHAAVIRELEQLAPQFWAEGDRGTALDMMLARAFFEVVFRSDSSASLRTIESALARYPLDEIPARERPHRTLAELYAYLRRPARVREHRLGWEASRPRAEWLPSDPFLWESMEAEARGDLQGARKALESGRAVATCSRCGLYTLGRVLDRLGHTDSAIATFERALALPPTGGSWFEEITFIGPTYQRLGELHEARGDREQALLYYGKFVETWRKADPEWQPGVSAAKARMAVLAGESR